MKKQGFDFHINSENTQYLKRNQILQEFIFLGNHIF